MTAATADSWSAPPPLTLLAPSETHVFAFALHLPTSRLTELEHLLSRDERDRAQRFRQARDRRRYVVGRAQLRTILAGYLGRDAPALEFRYGAHGKPALHGENGCERVRFNMSGSHELGVLAMQLDEDLGIDLERVRPFPAALDVAKRLFAPEEHAALCSLPAAELNAAFFSYWTRKEAAVKSIGLGLSHPIGGFVLTRPRSAATERVVIGDPRGSAVRWSLTVPPPSEGYVAALATAGALRTLRCWAWREPPGPRQ